MESLSWKIPLKWMISRGTPISGNPHMTINHSIWGNLDPRWDRSCLSGTLKLLMPASSRHSGIRCESCHPNAVIEPKWRFDSFVRENPTKMDDLGASPLMRKPPEIWAANIFNGIDQRFRLMFLAAKIVRRNGSPCEARSDPTQKKAWQFGSTGSVSTLGGTTGFHWTCALKMLGVSPFHRFALNFGKSKSRAQHIRTTGSTAETAAFARRASAKSSDPIVKPVCNLGEEIWRLQMAGDSPMIPPMIPPWPG